jgi:hypothetical protein
MSLGTSGKCPPAFSQNASISSLRSIGRVVVYFTQLSLNTCSRSSTLYVNTAAKLSPIPSCQP